MEDNGRFAVIWSEEIHSDTEARFFLQRFRRNSEKRGNKKLLLRAELPAVFAMDPSGEIVGIRLDELVMRGRWFDRAGRPQGDPIAIDGEQEQDVGFVVTKDAFGNAIVLWATRNPPAATTTIFGRIFDRTGRPVGDVLELGPGRFPSSLAVNKDGTLVVVWMEPEDRRHTRVLAQRFQLSCAPGYEHRCSGD